MHRPALSSRASRALVVAVGFALSAPAGAEPLAWDQARVTELAKQLVGELDAALAAASESPAQETVRQQRQRDAAIGQVRRVRQDAAKLFNDLRGGRGRYPTAPIFQRALERASETFQIGGDAVAFKEPVAHWEAAGEIARAMARYYEET